MAVFFLTLMMCLGTFVLKISYQHFLFINQIEKSCYWEENYNSVALMSIEWKAKEVACLAIDESVDDLEKSIYLHLFYKKRCEKIKVEVTTLEGYQQIKLSYRDEFTADGEAHYCILNILKSGEKDGAYKILEAGIISEERIYAY